MIADATATGATGVWSGFRVVVIDLSSFARKLIILSISQ